MLKNLILLVSFLGLVGCENFLKTPDGTLPDKFLPYASQLAGDYAGTAEGSPGTISLHLDGNRLTLSSTVDLTGLAGCHSLIGALQGVSFKENDGKVELRGGVFDFNPGLCPTIMGRTVRVELKDHEGKLELETLIYEHSEFRMTPYPCGQVGEQCWRREEIQYFLVGSFSR